MREAARAAAGLVRRLRAAERAAAALGGELGIQVMALRDDCRLSAASIAALTGMTVAEVRSVLRRHGAAARAEGVEDIPDLAD